MISMHWLKTYISLIIRKISNFPEHAQINNSIIENWYFRSLSRKQQFESLINSYNFLLTKNSPLYHKKIWWQQIKCEVTFIFDDLDINIILSKVGYNNLANSFFINYTCIKILINRNVCRNICKKVVLCFCENSYFTVF